MSGALLRWCSLALLLANLAGVSSIAEAQRRRRVSPEEQRARELYEQGDSLYENGRYEEAIQAFQEAYRFSPRPLLLYNLANAQERAGSLEAAIISLNRYLPDAPAEEREVVENRIRNLTERVEAERLEREAAAAAARQPTAPPPPGPAPEPPGPDLVPAIVLLAAAGALAIGGAVTGGLALGARDEASAFCVAGGDSTLCAEGASSALASDEALSITTDVLFGAAIAAAGVGLYFLLDALLSGGGTESASRPTVRAGVLFDLGGAGMVTVAGHY